MTNKNQNDELKIKVALEYSNNIISTLREPFLVLDKNLRIISANQSFYNLFDVAEKDTIGQLLNNLGNRQWDIPEVLHLLKEILPDKKVLKDYEVEHKFEQIGERIMLLNACQVRVPKQMVTPITAAEREERWPEEDLILLAIEDATGRKRMQIELKESEERFRRVFETSRDGLLLVDKIEGNILNSNESAQKLLGYSSEDFLKKKLWEVGLTKDNKGFQYIVSRLEKDGVVYYEDMRIKTQKGLSIDSEVFLVNRAKVIQCNIRDITQHKQLQSTSRLATVVRDSNDAIIIHNFEGYITAWNHGAEMMYGYNEGEALGMNIERIVPSDSVAEQKGLVRRLIAGEAITSFEIQRVTKDGRIIDVWLTVTKLQDDNATPIGIVSTERDITARKKMEYALWEEKEKFRIIFDNANDGMLLAEVTTKKFYTANNTVCQMLGYSIEEIKNLGVTDIHPKEDLPYVLGEFEKQIKREIAIIKDLPIKRKDGIVFYADISSSPIVLNGKTYLLGIFRDTTERKWLEAQLISSEKMAGIGRLAAAVTHELRNPLMYVTSNISLLDQYFQSIAGEIAELEKNSQNALSERQETKDNYSKLFKDIEQSLKDSREGCTRINDIIAGLLDYARNDSGVLQPADLSVVINKALEFVSNDIRYKCKIEKELQELPKVLCNQRELEQIFVNLFINASQAVKKDGLLKVKNYLDGSQVVIEVSDNGAGIAKENLDKIFEPFFTTKKEGEGTGLGLAIIHKIIMRHNGSISVNSEVGKGTTFIVKLPVNK